MDQTASVAFQVAAGIGLAACAGLRAFLPLFLVSAAAKLGWIGPAAPFEWLGTWPALIVLGVAVVVEVVADKVPLVDHALDVIQAVVKPAAGAVLAMAAFGDVAPEHKLLLGIIAGGGTAGVVHAAKAKLRLASSVTTAGLGNPFLSFGEDLLSTVGTVLALVFPFFLLLCVAATGLLLVFAARRFRSRVARLRER
jgi:uncharacterized membrane protein